MRHFHAYQDIERFFIGDPMKKVYSFLSTGLPGLDAILTGVRPGDNIVLQIDDIQDYIAFVHPFCQEAQREERQLIYFRFAEHQQLLPEGATAEIHQLHPENGFENFISDIFDVIERVGIGGCYVFDCLSGLAADWYSDRMLGNFFMLTCPYLYSYETATFFALTRNYHTQMAIDAIHNTAQVIMDVYRHDGSLYVHPLKVYKRYSETMYMLHEWRGNLFFPVTRSATISAILASVPQPWLDFTIHAGDVWTRTFCHAQELADATAHGHGHPTEDRKLIQRLLRMAITRDERLFNLAEKYFDLGDLIDVGKRMIGTGLIGGKSVGMLLSRAVLKKEDPYWRTRLESHDSFFIGSDVFYTYLILNGCWWVRRRLKNPAIALDGWQETRQRLMTGTFPQDIQDQFMAMLNYFGQSPIIVRSSSLLEDAYGNAFSGKYESVFCANQGSPDDRLENFLNAVRKVYASTMSRDALTYRMHWGLLEQDEQMALLVQRVCGENYGQQFYPQVAGVGFSFNPFVWNKEIDPTAGIIRLVFGLGTRAVDRADDDYTRIVSLSAPQRRPESTVDEVRKYTQRRVDVLDLQLNQHVSRYFEDVAHDSPNLPIDIFASRDDELERRAAEFNWSKVFPWILTFEKLLSETKFVDDMKRMLATIHAAYNYPVDIEFAAHFLDDNDYRINLLQCRPFQVKGHSGTITLPKSLRRDVTIISTDGPIIGNSRDAQIDRIVFVSPDYYGRLNMNDRYSVARLIGRLTHLQAADAAKNIMLVGPGRWGTTTPALGVPVSFSEINSVSVLCEIALMHGGLVPDVSLGTHFFNDIVEMDMLYMAVYPERESNVCDLKLLQGQPNRLGDLLPDSASWAETVKVFDSPPKDRGPALWLTVDSIAQKGFLYLQNEKTAQKGGSEKRKSKSAQQI
jgi:pyruvate,water dikinase